jgi:hypothetical protein
MRFTSSKSIDFLSSFLRFDKAHPSANRKHQETRDGKKIRRPAYTDYRISFDSDSNEWVLCFVAYIRIKQVDIDYEYFDECGRTGITTAIVYGNGRMEFDEEDVELDKDHYEFC